MSPTFSIGEMARRADVKVVTVRYYESIGLLAAPARSPGNYRRYASAHLERLAFIRRCRNLGFTLDQIREMVQLSEKRGQSCGHVDDIARTHLADVEDKLADLESLARELRRIVRQCRGGTVGECRIIEALSGENLPAAMERLRPAKERSKR